MELNSCLYHRDSSKLVWRDILLKIENVQVVKSMIFFKWQNCLTQQHAVTVIWMVFLPGWQTSLRYRGLCEVLFSPRSMFSGLALTLTVTDAGQFVFICLSSWWKHLSCNSRSDLKWKQWKVLQFKHLYLNAIFFLFSSPNASEFALFLRYTVIWFNKFITNLAWK